MKGIIGIGLAGGLIVAATYVTSHAGVVIPSGPEHRELHSVVIFMGGYKGEKITLDIQALQDGDFIQYISAISTDCDDEKEKAKGHQSKCPQVGHEANTAFTQTVKNRTIVQLSDCDLDNTVFLATILKKQ